MPNLSFRSQRELSTP